MSSSCKRTRRVLCGLLAVFCLRVAKPCFFSPSTAANVEINCFGDSLTEGIYSAPWVEALENRLGRKCCNHGINAETAVSIARRAAVASNSEDAVVLAGTNDALLELASRNENNAMLAIYRGRNRLPLDYVSSPWTFADAYARLLASVPARRLAVVSLPPLGESKTGEAVDVVAAYNAEIRRLVDEDQRAVYVPFGETLTQKIQLAENGEAFDGSSTGFGRAVSAMYANTASHLFTSFDALAKARGGRVLHDQIHLTESSVEVLLDLLNDTLAWNAKQDAERSGMERLPIAERQHCPRGDERR